MVYFLIFFLFMQDKNIYNCDIDYVIIFVKGSYLTKNISYLTKKISTKVKKIIMLKSYLIVMNVVFFKQTRV